VPHFPRFRALALFGRRPPERAVGIVIAGVRKPAQQETLGHLIDHLVGSGEQLVGHCEAEHPRDLSVDD
jgi:hypothetical protein